MTDGQGLPLRTCSPGICLTFTDLWNNLRPAFTMSHAIHFGRVFIYSNSASTRHYSAAVIPGRGYVVCPMMTATSTALMDERKVT